MAVAAMAGDRLMPPPQATSVDVPDSMKKENLATELRTVGDDVEVVSSDRRLLRASTNEGIATFDPETQSDADFDALIGS